MSDSGFPEGQLEIIEALPGTDAELADTTGLTKSAVRGRVRRINESCDGDAVLVSLDDDGTRRWVGDTPATQEDTDDDRGDLTQREAHIYRSLPASTASLATDLDVSEAVVEAHLDTIAEKGWELADDGAGNYLGLDQDHLRSSEHKQTRTRKANRWWQRRHDELVHVFQSLEWPRADFDATPGREDWVLHLTDLHAGDVVRRDDGKTVYETAMIPDVVDYITQKSLTLARIHGVEYDAAHLLWNGDFITNEGIYEGQFEDLDAWLDEQHDILVAPLMRQLKAFAQEFDTVQVVCQPGNHGNHRASGTSRQANADLILYKHIRNNVASLRKWGETDAFDNINFLIGEARPFRNFEMRGGRIRGHLRHGQNRKPQAVTASGSGDWTKTLRDHEFDVAYMGHHHISGRIPWGGPPIIVSGSPKPPGEFVERIGARGPEKGRHRDIATSHGVSDAGLTCVYPIDTRDYSPPT